MGNYFSLLFLILVFISFCEFTLGMSSINKDQIECTFCSSCDNPCQTIFSPPPPPPPVQSPPPPAPPTGSGGGSGVYYLSPPPPSSGGGGGAYQPPSNPYAYGTLPPPNPIVPYFPYYYYNTPPASPQSFNSHSVQLRNHPFISLLIFVIFSSLLFL